MSDKPKGPGRGRGFKPRFATCKKCGEPYWKETARRQYCDACRIVREEERAEERRVRMRNLYKRKRDGLLPVSKLPKVPEPETGFKPCECLVWQECEYGENWRPGCNYFTVTGELRTKGGRSPVVDGRCDRFKPKKKKRKPGWQEMKGGEYDD